MTLLQLHERLLSWATEGSRGQDLLAAKAVHFAARGEPHEEDRSYEVRVSAMLDFYLFDWRHPADGRTPLERYLVEQAGALPPEEAEAVARLTTQHHGLFEIRRLADGAVRVRDLFTGKDHDVTERRTMAGLEKGDLIEARLLPSPGGLLFSGAFLYHPREARKAILGEVKRLRKAAGKLGTVDVSALLDTLSRMAMKLERYRNVRLESIYDFSPGARR